MANRYFRVDGSKSRVAGFNLGQGWIEVTSGTIDKFKRGTDVPTPDEPIRLMVAPTNLEPATTAYLATGIDGNRLTGVAVDPASTLEEADVPIGVGWVIYGSSPTAEDFQKLDDTADAVAGMTGGITGLYGDVSATGAGNVPATINTNAVSSNTIQAKAVGFSKMLDATGSGLVGAVGTGSYRHITIDTNSLAFNGTTLKVVGAPATTIAGLISDGENVTITGSGTAVDPYVISSTGGGGGGDGITAIHGDGSASGTGDVALTLATVNSNVGTFQGLTVNAKGLVTAASNQSYATSASLTSGLSTKQNVLTTGSTSQYLKGDLSLGTFATDVAANLPTTSLTINQYKSVPATASPTTGAVTLAAGTATNYELDLTGDSTITLSGGAAGARVNATVWLNGHALSFGGSGSNAIVWRNGSAPVAGTDYDATHPIDLIFTWKTKSSSWLANFDAVFLDGGGDGITALTGDVTASGPGSAVSTIGARKVDFGKFIAATGSNKIIVASAAGSFSEGSIGSTLALSTGTLNTSATAQQIDSCTTAVGTATGATPTLDLGAKANWVVTLNANATFAFSNAAARRVLIDIKQDASTAYTYALPGGITYDWRTASGSAPATPAAGKALTLTLLFIDATHATVFVAWSAA